MTKVSRECTLDGVTRKTRSKVSARRSSGQRMKRFSEIEGILDERWGESKIRCAGGRTDRTRLLSAL